MLQLLLLFPDCYTASLVQTVFADVMLATNIYECVGSEKKRFRHRVRLLYKLCKTYSTQFQAVETVTITIILKVCTEAFKIEIRSICLGAEG